MTDAWRRYLAAVQIAGGLAGFVGLRIWQLPGAPRLSLAAAALAALYFSLSIVAGLLLRRRHPAGVPLSLAVQLPQIFVLLGPESNLLVLAGPYLRVLLPGSAFGVGVGGGGLCDATLFTGPFAGHVGVSLDVGVRQYLVRREEFRAYGVNVVAAVSTWTLMRAWTAEPAEVATSEAAPSELSAPVVERGAEADKATLW